MWLEQEADKDKKAEVEGYSVVLYTLNAISDQEGLMLYPIHIISQLIHFVYSFF
jgi:hypothetical protein